MYSLLSTFLALVLLVLVGILVFMLRKKINSLISWLQILFCVSFFRSEERRVGKESSITESIFWVILSLNYFTVSYNWVKISTVL